VFRGRYEHTIDAKGRVSVPARFRDVLKRYETTELVIVPDGECLEVYPLSEWDRLEAKLRQQSQFNFEVREISRLYISRARDAAVDAVGRILIPPDTRQDAGLAKNVLIIGGGLEKFEVWDRPRFEEYERVGTQRLASLYDKLSTLGV
jgi:MraZ protein